MNTGEGTVELYKWDKSKVGHLPLQPVVQPCYLQPIRSALKHLGVEQNYTLNLFYRKDAETVLSMAIDMVFTPMKFHGGYLTIGIYPRACRLRYNSMLKATLTGVCESFIEVLPYDEPMLLNLQAIFI